MNTSRPAKHVQEPRQASAQETFTVTNACVGCGACIATCPERAFRAVRPARAGDPPLVVLAARCTSCGECAEVCPADACVEREGPGEGERQRAGGWGLS